jgi:PAS domain S-box-containing protein
MGTENRYKRLFETAGEGILILHANTGEITDINPFLTELMGITRKEITGKKLGNTALFKGIRDSGIFFKKLRNKKYFHYDNLPLRIINGKEITVEVIGNVYSEDNTKMIQCNIRDISVRKNLEEALGKSEQKYRDLFEHSCEAIIVSGPDSRVIDANPAAAKMFGFRSREDMLGMYAVKLYANSEQRAAIINELYAKGYNENFEVEMIKQDGSGQHIFAIVSAVLYKDEQGQILRVEAMLIDITEHKHVFEELRQSKENFRSLAENASDGIIIVTGKEGRFIYANKRACEITGYTVDELLEMRARDVVIPDEYPKILERYRNRIGGRNVIKQYETTFIIKDGTKVRIEISPSITIWQKELADMVLFRDITERKQVEQELKYSRDTLRDLSLHIEETRESERAKIAMDLHDDLGQKLTALNIDLGWLKKKLTESQPEIKDRLNSMSELLMDTIDTIRTISSELRPGILDDLGLIAAIEWQLEEFEKRTGISFELTITPEEFAVSPDISILIFRIAQEVLTNITRHANATIVKIDLTKNENSIKLIAIDNGRGIKKAEINDPKSFGIIGMKERVKSFGGNFHIRGAEGKGTEVMVEIPLN